MIKEPTRKHKWVFAPRFRYQAFGWRSQPAILRVNEAVAEIKAVGRHDQMLAGEGAILLLEKLSPALEQVDSSSGAIGSAVNNAIEALVPIIAEAPADEATRSSWLDRLWQAVEEDAIPYIEILPEYWGELCHTQELASRWADELILPLRHTWSQDRKAGGRLFQGHRCLPECPLYCWPLHGSPLPSRPRPVQVLVLSAVGRQGSDRHG